MKPTELRIGNLVNHTSYDSSITIHTISGYDLWHSEMLNDVNHLVEWNSLTPIPLTEEWLIKFGFKKNFIKGISVFEFKLLEFSITTCEKIMVDGQNAEGNLCLMLFYGNPASGYERSKTIYFIHQLQNLYFALTGKELTKLY